MLKSITITVSEEENLQIKKWQKASPRNKVASLVAELLLNYIRREVK